MTESGLGQRPYDMVQTLLCQDWNLRFGPKRPSLRLIPQHIVKAANFEFLSKSHFCYLENYFLGRGMIWHREGFLIPNKLCAWNFRNIISGESLPCFKASIVLVLCLKRLVQLVPHALDPVHPEVEYFILWGPIPCQVLDLEASVTWIKEVMGRPRMPPRETFNTMNKINLSLCLLKSIFVHQQNVFLDWNPTCFPAHLPFWFNKSR